MHLGRCWTCVPPCPPRDADPAGAAGSWGGGHPKQGRGHQPPMRVGSIPRVQKHLQADVLALLSHEESLSHTGSGPFRWPREGGQHPLTALQNSFLSPHSSRLGTVLPGGPSSHTGPLELIQPSSEKSKCVLLLPSRGPRGGLWLPLGTQPSPGLWAHP